MEMVDVREGGVEVVDMGGGRCGGRYVFTSS